MNALTQILPGDIDIPLPPRSSVPCNDCDPHDLGKPGKDSCTKCDGTALLPTCNTCDDKGVLEDQDSYGVWWYCGCRIGDAHKEAA